MWWQHAGSLRAEFASDNGSWTTSEVYRFGEGLLELDTDEPDFRQRFREVYAECAFPASAVDVGGVRVRCTMRTARMPQAVWLAFDDADLCDMLDFSLRLFPERGYEEIPSPVAGWRCLARTAAPGVPFMLVQGHQGLIDRSQPWQAFVGGCMVNRVLRLQQDVLFFHAASVGVGERGLLLIGPKGAGKSTTALTLASRGHAFLGDEMAAVRQRSGEMLPVRRAVSIRPGPRAPALEDRLRARAYPLETFPDGTVRVRAQMQQLFPAAPARPLRLCSAVFLRQFTAQPRLEPFIFTPQHVSLLQPLSCTLWGVSPGRRLMEFLTLFGRLRCYFLDVGAPEETADLIESLREVG